MKALTVIALCALGFVSAACSTSQSRGPGEDAGFRDAREREEWLHGNPGFEIARTYQSAEFRQKMSAEPPAENVAVEEFFTVRVARDQARRDQLSDAGYARRRIDFQSGAYYYEFFDTTWTLIAYLSARGELFVVNSAGKADQKGRFQVDDALILVYGARGGFSYDIGKYDDARAKAAVVDGGEGDAEAAEIRGRSSAERGVFMRAARDSGPVVELRRYRPTEIGALADTYRKDRFDANKEEELRQLRALRRGTEAPDGAYGGVEFKDGQPVDENGKPIQRGDKK